MATPSRSVQLARRDIYAYPDQGWVVEAYEGGRDTKPRRWLTPSEEDALHLVEHPRGRFWQVGA